MYGFVRCASAIPKIKVADCKYNSSQIIELINKASEKDVELVVFPELCITGYTCGDLFLQSALLNSSLKYLEIITEATKGKNIVVILGLPINIGNCLYNCAVSIYEGKILGVVPKTFLPNYDEFYEKRWFKGGGKLNGHITICSQSVPVNTNIIFKAEGIDNFSFGIEICEDLWVNNPPSCNLTLSGALIIANPSASSEIAGKNERRLALVSGQSSRCSCGYVYTSSGVGESTQDVVFSGHSIICENGTLLNESKRFLMDNQLILSDVDTELLLNERRRNMNYDEFHAPEVVIVPFAMKDRLKTKLERHISTSPFIPENKDILFNRCSDIFNIQVAGLAKRIMHTKAKSLIIGISGGLDSTLALLVSTKACDYLGLDRTTVLGITMPGFGTTDRTYHNAISLMESLGISQREIPISEASMLHFKNIGHNPEVHDITYENTQARERTQILMDISNMENGLVIGTGDLSELALGWATYNGDHMAMYSVNSGVPKTLVRVLVDWVARHDLLGNNSSDILLDILDTPVSPELLPPDENNKINQKTEELVGPYELHDFFLYNVVSCGFAPKKIYYLAINAFESIYDKETILKWLKSFYKRFFSQQFKRSCLPDGPKVGTISLSPRGDWRMPSDAMNTIWMDELENL